MKYVGATGINMGNTKVENVAAATAPTDAASKAQVDVKPSIHTFNGSIYVEDPTVTIYERDTGEPAPPTVEGDIVLTRT